MERDTKIDTKLEESEGEGEEFEILMKHPFLLRSAYRNFEKHGDFVTNFKTHFRECLDYIWYRDCQIKLDRIKKLPGIKELNRFGTLPSMNLPSDHLMLQAYFEFLN